MVQRTSTLRRRRAVCQKMNLCGAGLPIWSEPQCGQTVWANPQCRGDSFSWFNPWPTCHSSCPRSFSASSSFVTPRHHLLSQACCPPPLHLFCISIEKQKPLINCTEASCDVYVNICVALLLPQFIFIAPPFYCDFKWWCYGNLIWVSLGYGWLPLVPIGSHWHPFAPIAMQCIGYPLSLWQVKMVELLVLSSVTWVRWSAAHCNKQKELQSELTNPLTHLNHLVLLLKFP